MTDFTPPGPETLRAEGSFETAMALVSKIPGPLGYIGFRKMKRRIADRSLDAFAACLAQLGPGDIVVDLGANVGDVTEELAATGATVHAFEPDPETFAHLARRFEGRETVILHNAAAGGKDGQVTLYRPASWEDEARRRSASKANSVSDMAARRGFTPSGEVPMVDFARFINELPQGVKLVKVDIEGAEWDLLDAVMTRAPGRFAAMFVETHERIDPAARPLVRRKQAEFAALSAPYINLFWK